MDQDKVCIGDPEDEGKVAIAKLVAIGAVLEEWRNLGAIAEEQRAYDYLVKMRLLPLASSIEKIVFGNVRS